VEAVRRSKLAKEVYLLHNCQEQITDAVVGGVRFAGEELIPAQCRNWFSATSIVQNSALKVLCVDGWFSVQPSTA